MRKALKISAVSFGILLMLLGLAAAYVQFAPPPTYGEQAIPEIAVTTSPERVAEGARIASMLCNGCHLGEDNKLSGQRLTDVPPVFGKFYSANITQHPDYGIGQWTDSEIQYLNPKSLLHLLQRSQKMPK